MMETKKAYLNPWNILNHPKWHIEEIPSWAIIRAMKLGAERRGKTIHRIKVFLAVVAIVTAPVLFILEWSRP